MLLPLQQTGLMLFPKPVLNDSDQNTALFDGLETITSVVARYTVVLICILSICQGQSRCMKAFEKLSSHCT